jgi:hypothetical protein
MQLQDQVAEPEPPDPHFFRRVLAMIEGSTVTVDEAEIRQTFRVGSVKAILWDELELSTLGGSVSVAWKRRAGRSAPLAA